MPREITIKPVLNGFVVDVGCQRVVFTNTKQLGVAVEEYYNHPEEVEAKYRMNAVNKMQGPTEACPPPQPPMGGCLDQVNAARDPVRSDPPSQIPR